ncbi:MAG: O-antigen ligase family protein, partial [Proteobacteria bacterium]
AWIFPPLGIPVSGFGELKKFHYFLYPPLVALALTRTSDSIERHPFWKIWAGMGVFLFFVSVAQFFAQDLFPPSWLEARFFRAAGTSHRFHGQGFMFFHLSFATCMSFVAAMGLSRFVFPSLWDQGWRRWAWGAVGLAGTLAVYFSFSRAGIIGLVGMVCTIGFLRRPLAGLGAVLACLLLGITLWVSMPSLRQRFTEAGTYNSERYIMWESAWEMFKERPVLGLGFGRTGEYSPAFSERVLGHRASFTSHAHNNILDIMGAIGGLGLAAFIAWWGVLCAWALRAFRHARAGEKWLPAAALSAFVAFHIDGLTQVNFWDGKSQHTLMIWVGVVLALELRQRARAARGEG